MTDENYGKCKTCRFCMHSKGIWICTINECKVDMDDTCNRYRPGSCENCGYLSIGSESFSCKLTGNEVDTLDVCTEYDPCGRRSI